MLKRIFTQILRVESRIMLARFQPRIIGITGSVGKTSTKDAIALVLGERFRVRKSPKSYNSEIGAPLAVLGLESPFRSPIGWLVTALIGAWRACTTRKYPEILVMEMGVDRPGDMDILLAFLHPSTAVMTPVGDIPVHVEFFGSPSALLKEKAKLIRRVPLTGTVVLAYDDPAVLALRGDIPARVLTYGFSESADVHGSNYAVVGTQGSGHPKGITFKISYSGSTVPIRIDGVFGRTHALAVLAAAAVGITQNMHLIDIAKALSVYVPPVGRARVLEGVNRTTIIDDTYNASPLAVHAALETLEEFSGTRKIAVLGDMLELGKFTADAHRDVGKHAARVANMVWTVGMRAARIAEGARSAGLSDASVREFSHVAEVAEALREILQKGDVVLFKASQGIRLEQAVSSVLAHPELSPELLVRQELYWAEERQYTKEEMRRRLSAVALFLFGALAIVWSISLGLILMLVGIVIALYAVLKTMRARKQEDVS